MLRSFLIYLSTASWARKFITNLRIVSLLASRFIAGETTEEAIKTIRELNAKGICATLDHLGENVTDEDEARRAAGDIIQILEEINRTGVKSSVSVKPSQIGLAQSHSHFKENLRLILQRAKELNNFVRIDMEDSPYAEKTLATFMELHQEGFTNHVGVVIQSYLYRSAKDIHLLMEEGIRVRLCKGAYNEPADIAFPNKKDVDNNFDLLTEMLISGALIAGRPPLSACGRFPPIPAIASHDGKRIDYAKVYALKVGLPKDALEFQMLNGIRRNLQDSLVAEGYHVRVYVPYGTEWYPYFMRRLAERPANVWFFLRHYLGAG
jgi:proline dehydrogenase